MTREASARRGTPVNCGDSMLSLIFALGIVLVTTVAATAICVLFVQWMIELGQDMRGNTTVAELYLDERNVMEPFVKPAAVSG